MNDVIKDKLDKSYFNQDVLRPSDNIDWCIFACTSMYATTLWNQSFVIVMDICNRDSIY